VGKLRLGRAPAMNDELRRRTTSSGDELTAREEEMAGSVVGRGRGGASTSFYREGEGRGEGAGEREGRPTASSLGH
jgi:hypothetical protein